MVKLHIVYMYIYIYVTELCAIFMDIDIGVHIIQKGLCNWYKNTHIYVTYNICIFIHIFYRIFKKHYTCVCIYICVYIYIIPMEMIIQKLWEILFSGRTQLWYIHCNAKIWINGPYDENKNIKNYMLQSNSKFNVFVGNVYCSELHLY